jgi:hypothetical protein
MSKPRGRPARPEREVRVVVHLRLREGEDDDLIAFFANTPPRQRARRLKLALRSGGMEVDVSNNSDVSDEELDDALDGFLF